MKNIAQIREVSTLSFNERVLQEAEDRRNPLLERLKFLGIYSSNMDEFYKVRVASIQRRIELGNKSMVRVLRHIVEKTRELDDRFQTAYAEITEGLETFGIRIIDELELAAEPPEVREWVREYFTDEVLPHLVPVILRDKTPLPQFTDNALYFGIKIWGQPNTYAILELPQDLPRFVELPNGRIMYIDDIIRHKLEDVFYIFRFERIGAFEFKISRDAELDIDNDFSEGYVRKMERILRQRKGGRPTRFVYDAAMPGGLLKRLVKGLNLGASDTTISGGRYHNMRDLMRFPVRRPELSFEELWPSPHPVLDQYRGRLIDLAAKNDVLITYPYQSFDHVVRLLREAAIDPQVQAIALTLYRVAPRSQVVNALINAARNGKQLFVNVELQARFDEHLNIRISQKLLDEHAVVTYGVPPLKVHAKVILIRHRTGIVCGFSTGNFNENTASAYVDSFLITANPELGAEAERLFDFFGQAAGMRALSPPRFRHLLVSPFNLRRTLVRQVDAERKKGPEGYIFLKVNHLTDKMMIQKIMAAANAGVKVDLVVRTTYALTPHPNIRAISILDRYLEHQRVYIFGRDEEARVYLSSADLMERNFDWRVEVAFPIYDPELRRQVLDIMRLQIGDNIKARILDESQSNPYVPCAEPTCRAQYATHGYFRAQAQNAGFDV
mgnify:CR=1 FL=1